MQRQQRLPLKWRVLADVCRKHIIAGDPFIPRLWNFDAAAVNLRLLASAIFAEPWHRFFPSFCDSGKAACRILRARASMLEQLKTARWNHPSSNVPLYSLVKETRPLRSNPALMGRVQPECQEQPKAGDFQSFLTTNSLPRNHSISIGIMKLMHQPEKCGSVAQWANILLAML